MSTYVITGGTTGIGAATRKLLLSQGHEVLTLILKEATTWPIYPPLRDAREPLTRCSAAIPTALMY